MSFVETLNTVVLLFFFPFNAPTGTARVESRLSFWEWKTMRGIPLNPTVYMLLLMHEKFCAPRVTEASSTNIMFPAVMLLIDGICTALCPPVGSIRM